MLALAAERSLGIARRDLGLALLAAVLLWLNQLAFVYSLDVTSASTIALRATLIANLIPSVAAVFALVLLSEEMTLLQVAGGVLIAGGILLARRREAQPPPPGD